MKGIEESKITGDKPEGKYFLFLGRINFIKGLDLLVNAFKKNIIVIPGIL